MQDGSISTIGIAELSADDHLRGRFAVPVDHPTAEGETHHTR